MRDRQLLEQRELLRPDEVAKIIVKSRDTVYRLIRSGVFKVVRNGHLRITAESVRKYVYKQREFADDGRFLATLGIDFKILCCTALHSVAPGLAGMRPPPVRAQVGCRT